MDGDGRRSKRRHGLPYEFKITGAESWSERKQYDGTRKRRRWVLNR
jgi:hypothetical protein